MIAAKNFITASILYDYIKCPHKVWRDIYGPQEEKIVETNPFVALLWEKGVNHEERIFSALGEVLDLREGSIKERNKQTIDALDCKTPLIYQGVIKHDNLTGVPDLLARLADEMYVPIDIKSGMAHEGADEDLGEEGKPKKHYAVQLCLYNDVLSKLGYANHRIGKIIDIRGMEVEYNLDEKMGPRTNQTWWKYYESTKQSVARLLSDEERNRPAMAGMCKLCPWYLSCKKWCEETKDLTNVFYLGRSMRDRLNQDLKVNSVAELISLDVSVVMQQKEKEKLSGNKDFLRRIGNTNLQKMINRAKILYQTKRPVAYKKLIFPQVKYELFFDIEDDPTQDYVYLHGLYVRSSGKEEFIHFMATEVSEKAERANWQKFWQYITQLPEDAFAVYYYSSHEKTTYKRLQKRYPEVVSIEELTKFFNHPNAIDLYALVQKQTDWPVGSYSLKALATFLGFKWRDETPSGELSIQWFNEYIETRDETLLQRILEYNEDDCKATMILKDAMAEL